MPSASIFTAAVDILFIEAEVVKSIFHFPFDCLQIIKRHSKGKLHIEIARQQKRNFVYLLQCSNAPMPPCWGCSKKLGAISRIAIMFAGKILKTFRAQKTANLIPRWIISFFFVTGEILEIYSKVSLLSTIQDIQDDSMSSRRSRFLSSSSIYNFFFVCYRLGEMTES